MTAPTRMPSMQESLLDVAGKKIFVAETGGGPPVLLLHGGGPGASGVSNYARNIAALAKEYRVIVPDLPGYGRSTKGVDGTDPFGALAAGIRGVLDRLGLYKATSSATPMSAPAPCASPSTPPTWPTTWCSWAPAASAPRARCPRRV